MTASASEHRVSIYQHLPIGMHESYYKQQAPLGRNLERLYESSSGQAVAAF